jgi:hypothetical protein
MLFGDAKRMLEAALAALKDWAAGIASGFRRGSRPRGAVAVARAAS